MFHALFISICGILAVSASKFEVRMLNSEYPPMDAPVCELLKSRAPKHWESKFFSTCLFQTQSSKAENYWEIFFTAMFEASMVCAEHPDLESHDYLMWYFNRMINGDKERCVIATGEAVEEDHAVFDEKVDYDFKREKLVLVGPLEDNFCGKMTNRAFFDDQLKIIDCHLQNQTKSEIEGHILGKYVLHMEQNMKVEAFSYEQNYMFFLRELNGPEAGCKYNGYVAPIRFEHIPHLPIDESGAFGHRAWMH